MRTVVALSGGRASELEGAGPPTLGWLPRTAWTTHLQTLTCATRAGYFLQRETQRWGSGKGPWTLGDGVCLVTGRVPPGLPADKADRGTDRGTDGRQTVSSLPRVLRSPEAHHLFFHITSICQAS